jgi:hypothetical protein
VCRSPSYSRTDSRKYGTRHRTVREVSATADGTAGARPAHPYHQSRLQPYKAVSSPAITFIVLFISMPNPTQSQSFLDIELSLPSLCTAIILLRSVLRAARSTLPLIFNFSFYSTRRTDGIAHFVGLFACQCLGFDPLHKVPT